MNIRSLISGLICITLGVVSFFYFEKLRKKDELDFIISKGYIGAIGLILCGMYIIINMD